jgi:capsular exopolysaccharide synthesis family protein
MPQLIKDFKSGSHEPIDLAHYFKILRQNWFKIALFSIMVTALTVLIVLQLTPKYTATATLLIEAQETKAVSIQDITGIDSSQKEYYQTQFEILKSNQIAERVIAKLNLTQFSEFNASLNTEPTIVDQIKAIPMVASLLKYDGPQRSQQEIDESVRQAVLGAFQQSLIITPVRNTQLVKISFTAQDPNLAAQIANAVGYSYIELNLDARLEVTQYASSWITGRLAELKNQLDESEKILSDYLVEEKLIDDSGIDALASQELSSLTDRLSEVRDRRIEVESAYSALRTTNARDVAAISAIPAISLHPQVVAIRAAEIEAQNEVNQLRKRYGAKHDKMIAAQARLNAVEDQAVATTRQLITGFGKEVQALRKQEGLIQGTIDTRRGEFQDLTLKKNRYESLKREVETNRDVLNVFLTRQKETSATQDFNSTNARFTDEAMIPQSASAPKKSLIVMLAFVASFGVAIILVLVGDMMRSTIESIKSFEDKFGLIPLGGVPQVKASRFKKKPLDNSVLFDDQEIAFGESIRSIRTSLMLNSRGNKRLAVTSSQPSEGKTTVAINLAMAFSKLENTVLLDCDLRKSSVAERFGLKRFQQGLSNYLIMGTELSDCLYKDETSGLMILPAGMLTTNPQELLSSPKFAELLAILDSQFDRIVVDTPPSLPVSDSLIIGQLTKSALVVVKANDTKQDTVKKTFAKLIQHEINIEGVVINQINRKQASVEYGYGDYSHYGKAE